LDAFNIFNTGMLFYFKVSVNVMDLIPD